MTGYRIKLVPLAEPNAEGEWRDITALELARMRPPPPGCRDAANFFASFVPEGFFLVGVESCPLKN
ncbi:hypothetical protein [Bradyrhizobium sp. 153]|uniref:hypothetical protein n=1 Tax=Bradyrhizobium sp. 153 TaxID=2782627 RepID=UPI001FFB143C|nr:hypothetical protein [Bradyrhizobium sp. 153]MCK1668639.1 hypothetical protein [Bradyrhizobium sp. 153]